MPGETMLRVANVEGEYVLETVRGRVDELGVEYDHVRSEPEDEYPQTAYFNVSEDSSETIDYAVSRLSGEYGYEARSCSVWRLDFTTSLRRLRVPERSILRKVKTRYFRYC